MLLDLARVFYPGSCETGRWSAQDCMTLDGVPYKHPGLLIYFHLFRYGLKELKRLKPGLSLKSCHPCHLTAYYLKQAGVQAVVLEADRIGSGQTKNTTAKITSH